MSRLPDRKTAEQDLSHWLTTPQGNYVLQQEQVCFDRTVPDIFGFNALQLGLPEFDFLRESRVQHTFSGGLSSGHALQLDPVELPFDQDSLDLVVMPHGLEFSSYPHQILRELQRVLRPEGELLLTCFNPRSLWGIKRVLGKRDYMPWYGEFVSLSRLKDWLALLGFEVIGGRFAVYAPPFRKRRWLERFSFMEAAGDRWWAICGGVYFVHAVKHIPGMNVIRPNWKNRLVSQLLPASGNLQNNSRRALDFLSIRHFMSDDVVEIFTDGACKGNPGVGGWGALLSFRGKERELSGGETQTTNNRMELMAAISALQTLSRPCRVKLYTDSRYVQQGISEWIHNWKKRGWRTADKKPVKNADLWQQLDLLTDNHEVEWVWVKGHAGHKGNERADELANRGVAQMQEQRHG